MNTNPARPLPHPLNTAFQTRGLDNDVLKTIYVLVEKGFRILQLMLQRPGLYILDTEKKGRGVFTATAIEVGEMIEICPVIKIPEREVKIIHDTKIHDYYFIWNEVGYGACLALGYGSLYNHDDEPNAQIILDYTDDTIKIESIKAVQSGEEILIDYTGGTKNETTLWF